MTKKELQTGAKEEERLKADAEGEETEKRVNLTEEELGKVAGGRKPPKHY